MRNLIAGCIGICALGLAWLGFTELSIADDSSQASVVATQTAPKFAIETLLSTRLEGVEGTEVIVSRVTMPPNTSLPKHWHPGEEFAYVLEGSASLRRDGKADVSARKGEVVKIALKEAHMAVTTDQGATILVFRIHEHGKPERVLVD